MKYIEKSLQKYLDKKDIVKYVTVKAERSNIKRPSPQPDKNEEILYDKWYNECLDYFSKIDNYDKEISSLKRKATKKYENDIGSPGTVIERKNDTVKFFDHQYLVISKNSNESYNIQSLENDQMFRIECLTVLY